MNKLVGFMRLMRPLNCAMMGFAVFVGALLASPTQLSGNWIGVVLVSLRASYYALQLWA